MQNDNPKTTTLKTTRTQGQILALVSEALRINAGEDMEAHIYLTQVDMDIKIESIQNLRPDGSLLEVDWNHEHAEVAMVKVRARQMLYCVSWNNAIHGTIEAKLRLVREYPQSPWKLHHLMLIQPDLWEGKRPSMYVVNQFADLSELEKILKDPGRFYNEWASHEAQNRSYYAPHLLRLSQLILEDQVEP